MPKVCIDAGHYGNYNRCPNNPNYYESNVVWKLHLLQKKYLEQLGIEVVTTRTNKDVDLSVTERGKKAKGCDLFISNHTNAVGSSMNETVDHVVIIHLQDDTTTNVDEVSKNFANKIAPIIASTIGVKQNSRIASKKSESDRNGDGIKNDNYYGVLHGSRSVGVAGAILEHSFHTNTRTVNWLLNDANLDKLARVEAECIASFLLGKTVTLDSKAESKEEVKTEAETVIYRVQVGAYSKRENAERMLAKVKAAGFDGFITTVKK